MVIENNNKYYKIKECSNYIKNGKCNYGDRCNYAHGKEDLREFRNYCISGLKCFRKDCKFEHPKGWNYKDNIKICEYYINGFCRNEDNCDFKHINENTEIIEQDDIKLDINNNNEFPYLKENPQNDIKINKNININNYINNIIKNHLHEDIIYNIIENVKNNNNGILIENDSFNIEIFVDGVKYNDIGNSFNNIENIKNNIINQNTKVQNVDINTVEIINGLQNSFGGFIKKIKENIDETFIGNNEKYGISMKMELNKIMSEILLFKNNFVDITNINNI